MSVKQNVRHQAQVLKGRIAEGVGRATGNSRLKRQGKTDQVLGNLKHSGQRVKAAFKR